jgi:surface antigen
MTTDATKGTTPDALDERLMALADGELGGDEALALRARIAADPSLAERFALFVETRALLAAEDGAAEEQNDPGLARLAAAIHAADKALGSDAAPVAPRRFGVIEGGAPTTAAPVPRARPASRFHVAAPALAASLALAIGGLLGYGVGRQGAGPGAGTDRSVVAIANAPAAMTAASRALQGAASGEAVAWTDGAGLKGAVTVLSSHRLGDDGVCREYEVTVEGRDDKAVALGCRVADGWRTELAARAGGGDGYAKASGASVAEAALADLGSSGAMTPEEEAALIKDGWPARK